nr:hypothetical protein TorRG33x02_065250 [Ipomoea trifida]
MQKKINETLRNLDPSFTPLKSGSSAKLNYPEGGGGVGTPTDHDWGGEGIYDVGSGHLTRLTTLDFQVNGDSAVGRAASFLLDRGGFHSPAQTKSALRTVLDSHPSHGSQTQPVMDPERQSQSA